MPDNNSRICGRPTSYDDLWGVSSKTCLFSCFKVDGIFQFPSISGQLAKHKKKSHFQLAKNKFLGRSEMCSAPMGSMMNACMVENSNMYLWNYLGTRAVFKNAHQQFVILLH